MYPSGAARILAFVLALASLTADAPASDSSGRPHTARIEVIRRFGKEWASTRPVSWESSWSPNGSRLILRKASSYVVFDRVGTRLLYRSTPRLGDPFTWSPDGNWVAYKGNRTIQAVELATGNTETIALAEDAWPVVWGNDGAIYAWSRDLHRFTLTKGRIEPSGIHASRIVFAGQKHLLLRTGNPPSDSDVLLFPESQNLARGPFARGRLYLISTVDNDTNGDALMDSSGKVLGRIPVTVSGGEIGWTSISQDGRWVVGHLEHDVGCGALAGSDLYVADTTGQWRLRVTNAGNALHPEFCPTADLVVYEDPIEGGVIFGRIVIK